LILIEENKSLNMIRIDRRFDLKKDEESLGLKSKVC